MVFKWGAMMHGFQMGSSDAWFSNGKQLWFLNGEQ